MSDKQRISERMISQSLNAISELTVDELQTISGGKVPWWNSTGPTNPGPNNGPVYPWG